MNGRDVAWKGYWPTPAARVPLPTYPFAAEPYWIDAPASAVHASAPVSAPVPVPASPPASVPAPASPSAPVRVPASPPVPVRARASGPVSAHASVSARVEGVGADAAAVSGFEDYLKRLYAEVSGIALSRLSAHVPLEHYGLNSYLVTRLNHLLERDLGEESRTLFYEYADLAGVAADLASRHAVPADTDADADADSGSGSGSGFERKMGEPMPVPGADLRETAVFARIFVRAPTRFPEPVVQGVLGISRTTTRSR